MANIFGASRISIVRAVGLVLLVGGGCGILLSVLALPAFAPADVAAPEYELARGHAAQDKTGGGSTLTMAEIGAPLNGADKEKQAECVDHLRKRGIVVDPSQCVDIDSIVAGLDQGTYKHNSPTSAYVGDDIPIVLTLETAKGQDVRGAFTGVPGAITTQQAAFARDVEATLTGNDVKIKPPGPQKRTATSAGPIEWRWQVTPLRPVPVRLDIEVVAEIVAGKASHNVQLRVLHDQIDIKATVLQRVTAAIGGANSLLTSITALIAGLLSLISTLAPVRKALANLLGGSKPSGPAS